MKRIALVLIAALAAGSAFADDVAKPDCKKPELPSKYATEAQFKTFNRHFAEYKECMLKFTDQQKVIVDAASKAANAAINEFNEFAKQVNAMSADQ